MTTKIYTNRELFALRNALASVKGYKEVRFQYALMKNIDKITSALKTLTDVQQKNEETIAPFVEKRVAKLKELAKKDENKQPVIITKPDGTQHYDLTPNNEKALGKYITELKEEYKTLLDQYEASAKEIDKLLDEPNEEYTIFPLKQECLPELLEENHFQIVYLVLE